MAGRSRNHHAHNGPRGSHRGLPGRPGLMHPVPGPFLPSMLPPHLAPHPGLPPMLIEQKLASQAEMQRLLSENLPPHLGPHSGLPPMLIEQKLATQHAEIQRLLSENQQLASTHIALRQELAAVQQEMQHMQADSHHETDKDEQIRALLEKVSQMEVDLRAMDSLKADLEKLLSQRQELSARLQFYTQESQRTQVDAHQIAALKSETEGLQQELQHARLVAEQERKASTEHLELRQAMERNVFSMVREVEKLRAALASAENRAQGALFSGSTTSVMPVKSHDNGYSLQQISSLGSWGGAYDTQQIMTSQEPVALVNGQINHMDSALGAQAAKYPLGSSNSHIMQQISQDDLIKLSNDATSSGAWSTHVAPSGKSFYYNASTGVTQWDKPAAMVAAEAQGLSQFQLSQPHEERRQVLESLLSQFTASQQQPSAAGMNQSVQAQVQQPMFFEQHALGQMQVLQSASAHSQNPSLQIQNLAQAQSPILTQLQMMQQTATAQSQPQSSWLAQSPISSHTQYAVDNSQSQVQTQLGSKEGSGQAMQNAHSAHVSAPPSVHPRPEASDVSLNKVPESVSAGNPMLNASSGPQGANLFVFGIPDDFNDHKLAELFRPYGMVLYAKVGLDRETGRGKGYGFISMDNSQTAEAAIGAVNNMIIAGKRIKVELKRGEHDASYQQQSQQNVLGGVGPTRWHNRSEMVGHRPY